VALLALAAVAAMAGAWRMQDAEASLALGKAQVQRFGGQQQIRGLVADDPSPRQRATSLTLSDIVVRNGEGWEPLGARVLVSVPHWPEHEYGEYLQLRGLLRPLSGEGAIEALGRQGVLASMSYPRVSYLANPQANRVLVSISRLRLRLGETISQTLPEPAASTLKATILGLRSVLPKDEQQALVNTGTVHLIVISGFKLTLLAAGLQALGLWVLRRTTARMWARLGVSMAVLATIAGYTVLTGATPSAVRAAIMAGLVVLAALVGRQHDQLATLAISVLAIVGLRPFELEDGGFQLSCLSVLGIALLAEPLAGRLRRPALALPDGLRAVRVVALALGEAIAASVAATAFVAPVLAASFHVVSVVSPLANLLGMPLLWPIMVLGGLGALFGSVWLPMGALLLWPAWAFTSLLEWIVHWTAALPYAALSIDGMAPEAVAGYYAVLLCATWLLRRGPAEVQPSRPAPSRRLAWSLMLAGALGVAAMSALRTGPPSSVQTTLLAVPGQAALIQTRGGRKVLIDGGESGAELLRQLGRMLPPWDRNLDLVLITSSRTDHTGGLDGLFGRYTVAAVVEPDAKGSPLTFQRLQARAQRLSADAVELGDGARLRHTAQGWQLEQGDASVLVTDRGFDVRTPDGAWRVLAMLRGAGAPTEDDAMALSETGNVTVTFGR